MRISVCEAGEQLPEKEGSGRGGGGAKTPVPLLPAGSGCGGDPLPALHFSVGGACGRRISYGKKELENKAPFLLPLPDCIQMYNFETAIKNDILWKYVDYT